MGSFLQWKTIALVFLTLIDNQLLYSILIQSFAKLNLWLFSDLRPTVDLGSWHFVLNNHGWA
jgi:hypothetical protein